jgi:growth hormone-inducible transmembrane protein
MGTMSTNPQNSFQKHAFWTAFQVSQGLFLAPMYFFAPAVLGRAALYTIGTVGSLSFIAATAKTDQYLYLGAPLLGGLVVVALSGLAPMVLPVTAVRSLGAAYMISMYGGIAVFGGLILYDTQKIMAHARMGVRDAPAESIGLELDIFNLFIRFVFLLGGGRRK